MAGALRSEADLTFTHNTNKIATEMSDASDGNRLGSIAASMDNEAKQLIAVTIHDGVAVYSTLDLTTLG